MGIPEAIPRVVRPGAPQYAVTIAQMCPWFFWARPSTLGLPDDAARAINNGTATPDQVSEMERRANAARLRLIEAPIPTEFVRPC